jgi:hypothetical protein
VHALALPLDPALEGLQIAFQALVLDATDEHYCNALDAVLSSQ